MCSNIGCKNIDFNVAQTEGVTYEIARLTDATVSKLNACRAIKKLISELRKKMGLKPGEHVKIHAPAIFKKSKALNLTLADCTEMLVRAGKTLEHKGVTYHYICAK